MILTSTRFQGRPSEAAQTIVSRGPQGVVPGTIVAAVADGLLGRGLQSAEHFFSQSHFCNTVVSAAGMQPDATLNARR